MKTPKTEIVDLNGHKQYLISYNPEQQGVPIILIHGLLLNPHFWWEDQVKQWAKYGPVYSISLTGHYPSVLATGFSGPVDEEFLADIVEDQVRYLIGDRPAVIIGHSTGALAAFCAALKYPARVKALGILSTYPHGREESGIYGFFQFLHCRMGSFGAFLYTCIAKMNNSSLFIHRIMIRDIAKSPRKMFAYPRFDEYVKSYFWAQQKLDNKSPGIWFRGLRNVDILDRIHNIHCPTLLMYSRHDKYMDYNTMYDIKKEMAANPKVTTSLIEDAGHLYMFEANDAYSKDMEKWLQSLDWTE
jgi:pimeloyl-ACP methyl ester carboxylesterase